MVKKYTVSKIFNDIYECLKYNDTLVESMVVTKDHGLSILQYLFEYFDYSIEYRYQEYLKFSDDILLMFSMEDGELFVLVCPIENPYDANAGCFKIGADFVYVDYDSDFNFIKYQDNDIKLKTIKLDIN